MSRVTHPPGQDPKYVKTYGDGRRKGASKLVYNKETKSIDVIRSINQDAMDWIMGGPDEVSGPYGLHRHELHEILEAYVNYGAVSAVTPVSESNTAPKLDGGKMSIPKGRHSDHPCEKCGAMEVYVLEYGDLDYTVTCHASKRSYNVDGMDS